MSAEQDREPALSQASSPAGAVFLSYASEDAAAAERIASALRAAGIEAWLDKSELRGGDAWDQAIRKQIKACALFIPIISRHAHDRIEGYFRLEWKLAVDRSHLIAPDQAFLLPVVIDDTLQTDERIPDRFRELQWTRLPAGETTPGFIERVRRLLLREVSSARGTVAPVSLTSTAHPSSVAPPRRSKGALWVTGAVIAVALAAIGVDRFLLSRGSTPHTPPAAPAVQAAPPAPATAAAFNPPPHSIAVLPFVNMSGDKEQEYFSEGLTEELLNSLAEINELQVAARTSSFSFQGEHPDIATVAHKLNVGAVLEGSVRRSANTVRVTAQLINGITGFHLWSETYDRNLGDILKLQTEIAASVATALKVTLLGDEAGKIEAGGTHDPAALDAYLRATKLFWTHTTAQDAQAAVNGYAEAIGLDPQYALAYAARAQAYQNMIQNWPEHLSDVQAVADAARADARKAIALAPDLSEGHLAMATMYANRLMFAAADEEFRRALALGPGSARVLRDYGLFSVQMGRSDGLELLRRAVVMDPLNHNSYSFLAASLTARRRYDEAISTYKRGLTLTPEFESDFHELIGENYYLLGNFEAAREHCETEARKNPAASLCLAVTYEKLGRHTDAEAMMTRARAQYGETFPTAFSQIYAQRGDKTTALKWLEIAVQRRDFGLLGLKTDPWWDPLRKEPRFQAIEKALNFPN